MSNPLFPNLQRALQQAAAREATIKQLGRTFRALGGSSRAVMRGARRLMADTEGMSQPDRYGRVSEFVRRQIINEVIRQLGTLGGLIVSMIQPQGRSLTEDINQEIEGVAQLLQEIAGPPDRPEWLPSRVSSAGSGGGARVPPSISTPSPAEPSPTAPEGMTARQVLGRRYQFNNNDPILTGEMIDVISTNVHSIGYDWNEQSPTRGTLKVRFLESTGRKSSTRCAGPLYFYFNVHPEVFLAFQQAASKGRFVWDRLRVRGTVSGHRYFYELEDTGSTDYIPRRATRLGPNEYYLRREHTNRQTGVTAQSQLEDEFVQRIGVNRHGPRGFVPNRGRPNRGRPNRGH